MPGSTRPIKPMATKKHEPVETPARSYVCITKCYFGGKLWDVGEETDEMPGIAECPYFEEV